MILSLALFLSLNENQREECVCGEGSGIREMVLLTPPCKEKLNVKFAVDWVRHTRQWEKLPEESLWRAPLVASNYDGELFLNMNKYTAGPQLQLIWFKKKKKGSTVTQVCRSRPQAHISPWWPNAVCRLLHVSLAFSFSLSLPPPALASRVDSVLPWTDPLRGGRCGRGFHPGAPQWRHQPGAHGGLLHTAGYGLVLFHLI